MLARDGAVNIVRTIRGAGVPAPFSPALCRTDSAPSGRRHAFPDPVSGRFIAILPAVVAKSGPISTGPCPDPNSGFVAFTPEGARFSVVAFSICRVTVARADFRAIRTYHLVASAPENPRGAGSETRTINKTFLGAVKNSLIG